MGRMVGRAAGCSAGFVDRHRLFDLAASDFDTRSGWPSAIQTVGGLFQLILLKNSVLARTVRSR